MLDSALTLKPDDIFVTPASVPGPDLILSPEAQKKFPFVFEGKNRESLNIWSAIEQAETHAKKTDLIPVVVFSRNHSKDFVVIEAETFFREWVK